VPETWYRWQDRELWLRLRVQPRASRDRLGEPMGDRLKVYITAPPADGKANEHLLRFLARAFRVPRGAVTLVSGETGREKTVRIASPQRLPDGLQGLEWPG
jgi:uncharacterized protein